MAHSEEHDLDGLTGRGSAAGESAAALDQVRRHRPEPRRYPGVAKGKRIEVFERGRIPKAARERYEAAHHS